MTESQRPKTLVEAAIEYELSVAGWDEACLDYGFPHMSQPMRPTFLAGAAAMAELFAQHQGPMLQLLRELAVAMTREAQALHDLVNRKLPEPEDVD